MDRTEHTAGAYERTSRTSRSPFGVIRIGGRRKSAGKRSFHIERETGSPSHSEPLAGPQEEREKLFGEKSTAAREAPKKKTMTTVLAVLFLVGVAYGAIMVGYLDSITIAALDSITKGFVTGRLGDGFLQICLHSLTSSLMIGGAMFLCGFSAVGQPFSLFFLLFRGIGLGMSMGYFYSELGGKGILVSLLMILPYGALSGYALLLGCRESLKLSNLFFRAMTAGATLSVKTFRVYGVKYLILTALLAASALLDGVCAKLFSSLLQG